MLEAKRRWNKPPNFCRTEPLSDEGCFSRGPQFAVNVRRLFEPRSGDTSYATNP
jgi:hypothetical protein